ncbi:MAG: DUF929 family protein [Candidatus Micrarchaeales archaeon]
MNKRNIAIIVVIGLIVVAALIWHSTRGSTSGLAKYDNVLVGSSFLSNLNVPNSVLSQIGIGAAGNFPTKINGKPALTNTGKPEILYIGAEYCPYCAAERWPMVIALSRFGTFSNLHYMTSSATDFDASTPTFTFYNSTYQSSYISFVPVEMTTNVQAAANYSGPTMQGYPVLQQLNDSQNNIVSALNPGGGIPFINFANKSFINGATYSPQILANMNWSNVASQFPEVNSTISESILGSANLITAAICQATNNTPASVCAQSYIQRIESFA